MRSRLYLLLGLLLLQSCTEPYALQTETFESALVIEGTITDEQAFQEIKLSRTYRLEEDGPDPETGAIVYVTDSNGNQYNFAENSDKYVSQQEFRAQPGVTYQLHVTTADGKTYSSTSEKLTSLTSIDEVEVLRGNNSQNEEGLQIFTKSTHLPNASEYYRYKYEETNKVIAPHWISYRGIVIPIVPTPQNDPTAYIAMEPWPYEAKTCYSTESSKEILLNTTSTNTSTTTHFLTRFLKDTDYKIANRYSIKVTMYNESLAAYNFYDALKKVSSGGSLLSQHQPGFYSGNIKNTANPTEKVIGFFDVSHVSSKRIFFNFEDYLPNHQKPDYPYYCPEITFTNEKEFKYRYCFCYGNPTCPEDPICGGFYILESVRSRMKAVYRFGTDFIYLTNIQCGDCTAFSSNIRPTFWID